MGNYYHSSENYINQVLPDTKETGIKHHGWYDNTYPPLSGAVYYISGGLSAQNNTTSYKNNSGGDYVGNASAWPDGSRTEGVFTYVACNNHNYLAGLQTSSMQNYYNSTNNNGLLIRCSTTSEMDFYHSRMCWGGDQVEVLKQFWGDIGKTQFLGAVHYRAPSTVSTSYQYNEWRVWNASGTLIQNISNWAEGPSPNYKGFWYGTLTFSNVGWYFLRQGDTGNNDGTYGIPTHTQSSLSFPDDFFIEFSARIYSSYCNSCTADSRVYMKYNYYL